MRGACANFQSDSTVGQYLIGKQKPTVYPSEFFLCYQVIIELVLDQRLEALQVESTDITIRKKFDEIYEANKDVLDSAWGEVKLQELCELKAICFF